MSSAVATPCSSMRIASSPSTTPSRLEAKPGESRTTIGSLPSRRASATARSTAAGSARAWVTTSTSFIACTGLKKCRPTTRPGVRTAAAMAPTDRDDVLVASRASGGVAASSSANKRRFTARSSTTASMTTAASRTAPASDASVRSRCAAAVLSPAVSLPRWTPPANSSRARAPPVASASALASVSATSHPASAATYAMPWPIVPAPTTATRGALMPPPRSPAGPRRARWCRWRPRPAARSGAPRPRRPRSRRRVDTPAHAALRRGRRPPGCAPATGSSRPRPGAAPRAEPDTRSTARRARAWGARCPAAARCGGRSRAPHSPPGAVAWMSSSTRSAPSRTAARNAAREFSTSRADAPRCAMTSGRVTSRRLEEAIGLLRLDPVGLPLDVVDQIVVRRARQQRREVRLVPLGVVHRCAVHRVHLVGVDPDLAVELEVGDLEPALPLRDEHVEPLDQLHDLLAVQLAAVLVQMGLVGLRLVVALVVAALQAPHVRPVGGRGVVGAEQVERRGDPLVEEPLDHLGRHLPRLDDAQQPVVAGAEVERFLLQHRDHRARQRVERRHRQHRELELAVAIDELRVGEEVEPVVHQLVERAEQALPLVGAAVEQLRRLALSLVTEVRAQQVRHLPAVPHLLGHDAHQRQQVVVRRGVLEEAALLLDGSELGIALVDDEIEQRVADALIGDMHHRGPFVLPFVMPELDVGDLLLAELGLELEGAQLALGQPDRVLPVTEVVDPVVEVAELPDH